MAKSVGLNRGSGKRNLTIQLDEATIQAAKELAVRKHTSISGLVTQKIREMVAADARYREAMRHALAEMDNAIDRGPITWTRDELYEEMFNE